jgi:hypothetical protein
VIAVVGAVVMAKRPPAGGEVDDPLVAAAEAEAEARAQADQDAESERAAAAEQVARDGLDEAEAEETVRP